MTIYPYELQNNISGLEADCECEHVYLCQTHRSNICCADIAAHISPELSILCNCTFTFLEGITELFKETKESI